MIGSNGGAPLIPKPSSSYGKFVLDIILWIIAVIFLYYALRFLFIKIEDLIEELCIEGLLEETSIKIEDPIGELCIEGLFEETSIKKFISKKRNNR